MFCYLPMPDCTFICSNLICCSLNQFMPGPESSPDYPERWVPKQPLKGFLQPRQLRSVATLEVPGRQNQDLDGLTLVKYGQIVVKYHFCDNCLLPACWSETTRSDSFLSPFPKFCQSNPSLVPCLLRLRIKKRKMFAYPIPKRKN